MNLIKFKNINFHKSFFINRLYPLLYDGINNKINGHYVLNSNIEKIDVYKNSIVKVNLIPPYFECRLEKFRSSFNYYKGPTHIGFLADLEGFESIDEYMITQFSSKNRNNLKRRIKKLEKCFKISCKMFYGEIDNENYNFLFDQLEIMINKRFIQRKQKHSSIENWEFYKNTTYSLILDKKASLFAVYDGKKPIAIVINYIYQNIFEYGIPSYDIDYAKFSIGNIVVLKELEWCFKNEFKIMNFGWGDLRYKREWCNTVYNYQFHILFEKNKLIKQLLAYIYCQLLILRTHMRISILDPIKEKIYEIKKKNRSRTENSNDFVQKQLFNKSDLELDENVVKLEYNKKVFSFLLKHIYEFQYNNSENSKDIEVYKTNVRQETNSYIISGKSKLETIKF